MAKPRKGAYCRDSVKSFKKLGAVKFQSEMCATERVVCGRGHFCNTHLEPEKLTIEETWLPDPECEAAWKWAGRTSGLDTESRVERDS